MLRHEFDRTASRKDLCLQWRLKKTAVLVAPKDIKVHNISPCNGDKYDTVTFSVKACGETTDN